MFIGDGSINHRTIETPMSYCLHLLKQAPSEPENLKDRCRQLQTAELRVETFFIIAHMSDSLEVWESREIFLVFVAFGMLFFTRQQSHPPPFSSPRPQEGLFGLREWSEDTQLKDLVAGEQDDPFFRPGHIGSVRRVVDQPYPYGYGNGPRHFGHNFAAAKARAEGSGKGKHSNHPLLQRAWSDESSHNFQGGMVGGYGGNYNSGKQSKKTGIKDDTDDDENEGLEGLGLLLDAASGMGNSDKKKEHPMARYNQQQAKKATSSRPAHQPGPITGSAAIPSLTVTQSQLLLQQARRNLLNSSSRDNGNANNNGNAVTEEKLATAIQEEKQIQLDRVVTALSAQCAELYIMLGPHEVVARELATLIVTLRSGGGKYQAQEKVVTGQLWELVRAMTFPQGMGDTQETQGALARVVASMIDNAAVTAAASLVEVSAAAEIKVRLGMASERD